MSIKYFDNASTTKVDSRVLETMFPYFNEVYGNASSNHVFGKTSKKAIELARKQVSKLINANENEIIFTSGATESINLALKGFIESNYDKGNHIITVKTEHKAVLSTCEYLETKGIEITYLDVDNSGLISINDLKKAIRKDTVLICVMFVNNETGIIQPINEIGLIARENNITFFSDATQAVGKIKVDVESDNIRVQWSRHTVEKAVFHDQAPCIGVIDGGISINKQSNRIRANCNRVENGLFGVTTKVCRTLVVGVWSA